MLCQDSSCGATCHVRIKPHLYVRLAADTSGYCRRKNTRCQAEFCLSERPLAGPTQVRPAVPVGLVDVQEIISLDDRHRRFLNIDVGLISVVDFDVADPRRDEPLLHQFLEILDRRWLRVVF